MFRLVVRLIKLGIVAGLAFFIVFQFVPYGRSHNDPPVSNPVTWNSPQTEQLAMRACGDCHSNQTTWPWYSNIAPFSWLIQHDVAKGRSILNFSDYTPTRRSDRAIQAVENGHMPPFYYTIMHPNSRLSASEKQQLIDGLRATFGSQVGSSSGQTRTESAP